MKRVVDLSLTISATMRGVELIPEKRLESEGWNATRLSLYSHCGTHMDAPRHFLAEGVGIDQQALSTCVGPAKVIDLTPIEPRTLITPGHLEAACVPIEPGDRLLLRTDWYRRCGTPEYRDALPRISLDLAHWLVARKVSLLGVEPPSVADVNNIRELTDVHHVLLKGGVVIVEGLAHLDQLRTAAVEFIVLPLKIQEGDGSPVRAIALEEVIDG